VAAWNPSNEQDISADRRDSRSGRMLDFQSPQVFRTVLENLKAGICLVDHDRTIVFWNHGAEAITGYLQQEALGRFCGEFLLVKFQGRDHTICEHACPLLSAMRDGQAREVPTCLHHKAGYPVPVTLRAFPLRNQQGHVIGAAESFVQRSAGTHQRRPESDLAVGHGLDVVTRLPDHRYTEWELLDHLQFASQHGIPFGLLAIKIEQLDGLTTRYGREAAEAILKVFAHTLRNGLEALDYVGRWLENQFLVVVANGDAVTLLATAVRLKRLASSSRITWWGDRLSVMVSVGGVVVAPGETPASVIARLEGALNHCISKGGGDVTVLGATEQE
jgi:diguanylate cyclase (GGDEF)-like protein/PAS domain S-box-containing protein